MTTKHIALLTLTAALTVAGCQKEEMPLPLQEKQQVIGEVGSVLCYTVNDSAYIANIANDTVLNNFLDSLIDLTRHGCVITCYYPGLQSGTVSFMQASVTTETFTSSNKEEVQNWLDQKSKEGYEVKLEYDDENGVYKGTATKLSE